MPGQGSLSDADSPDAFVTCPAAPAVAWQARPRLTAPAAGSRGPTPGRGARRTAAGLVRLAVQPAAPVSATPG